MSTSSSDGTTSAAGTTADSASEGGTPWIDGLRFDALFVALSVVAMFGLAWDFRVHAGGISFEEEGFWTLAHMFVYGGGLGVTALLGWATVRNRRKGRSWLGAIPSGYGLGLAGIVLFGLAGASDYVWHIGISHENGTLEALTSPSHLGLAAGGGLFLSSPLRSTWRRAGSPSGIGLLPALLSLSFCLSILVVFLAYANPLTATQTVYGPPQLGRTMGLAGMILFPTVLLGSSLALARRFELPPGALTLTFFIPGLVSVATVQMYELLLAVIVTGVVADLLVALAPPTPSRPRSLRLFGAFVPMSFAGTFFFVVATWYDLARVWSTTTWTGAIIVAGLSGLLVTYAIVPDGRRVTVE